MTFHFFYVFKLSDLNFDVFFKFTSGIIIITMLHNKSTRWISFFSQKLLLKRTIASDVNGGDVKNFTVADTDNLLDSRGRKGISTCSQSIQIFAVLRLRLQIENYPQFSIGGDVLTRLQLDDAYPPQEIRISIPLYLLILYKILLS